MLMKRNFQLGLLAFILLVGLFGFNKQVLAIETYNGKTVVDASATDDTSDLKLYFGNDSDQGKVWTDKTVNYGYDNYDVFDNTSYKTGYFSITLSALAQAFVVSETRYINAYADVVLVLDMSSSMADNSKAKDMVDVVNDTIKSIMTANSHNRVGVVTYNSGTGSTTLLPLASYGVFDQYLNYQDGYSINTIYTSTNINKTVYSATGTFTQGGIAEGGAMLNSATLEDNTIRVPFMILLSDGVPTVMTSDYQNPNDGSTTYFATSVIERNYVGFYSILTADYWKNVIDSKYKAHNDTILVNHPTISINTDISFYTIGFGLNTLGNSSYAFAKAILNPDSINLSSNYNSTLSQYLNDFYTNNFITFDNISLADTNVSFTTFKSNTMQGADYSTAYYDPSDKDELSYAFNSITRLIEYVSTISYPLDTDGIIDNLNGNSYVRFEDLLGDGFEVKSPLIIRYNGTNYNYSSYNTVTDNEITTTTYLYNYSVIGTYGAETNLNQLLVQIVTNTDTNSTSVVFKIPANLLPVFYPDNDHSNLYDEEDPIRLIYQVGLEEDLQIDTTIQDTYCTNKSANVSFIPAVGNSYYYKSSNKTYDYFNLSLMQINDLTTNSNIFVTVTNNDNTKTTYLIVYNGGIDGTPNNSNTVIYEVVYKEKGFIISDYNIDILNLSNAEINTLKTNKKLYKNIYINGEEISFVAIYSNDNDQTKLYEITYDNNSTKYSEDTFYNTMFSNGIMTINLNNKGIISFDYETKNLVINKIWNDNNNIEGLRPDNITVQLYADGEKYKEPIKLTKDNAVVNGNTWTFVINSLPTYANITTPTAKQVTYTIDEISVKNYHTNIDELFYNESIDSYETTVNNTRNVEFINIDVIKIWNDNNNIEKIRPSSITINLMANNEIINTLILNENSDWKGTFSKLPKYSNGKEIIYKIQEEDVDGYIKEIGEVINNGNNNYNIAITNTHAIGGDNPKTGDNIMLYLIMLVSATISLLTGTILYKKIRI